MVADNANREPWEASTALKIDQRAGKVIPLPYCSPTSEEKKASRTQYQVQRANPSFNGLYMCM